LNHIISGKFNNPIQKIGISSPLPEPLPPGAGEKRFLPLDGGGLVGVLNCYENCKIMVREEPNIR